MDIKKGSLSYILLTTLEKSIEAGVSVNHFIDGLYLDIYSSYPRAKKMPGIYKAIQRLKKKGFVESNKEDNELFFKLTDEGHTALILMDDEIKEWDNKWRIVIFDIPEQKRLIRNIFRRNLKKWGFKPLQKSVWISKKNVTEKLFCYINDLKIEKWVLVFESEKIGPVDIT